MPKPEIERRVQSAAQLLQIQPFLGRRPKELSGGQRQRVAIGRAITRDPKIFLFDEPLSNLDAELRVQMRTEIGKLHERLGNTMIYVTHDQVEAMTMADKIVVLRKGRVEQVGAPLALYNTPANKFVAGFIGSPRMNFIEGRAGNVTPTSIEFLAEDVPPITLRATGHRVTSGDALSLGIRAEDITLGGDCHAVVEMTELYGASSYLHCHLPGDVPLLVHQAGQSKVRKSDVVNVQFPPDKCHLFDEAEQAIAAGAALGEAA
jgi:multiple sugar transport system ATP-binding protein